MFGGYKDLSIFFRLTSMSHRKIYTYFSRLCRSNLGSLIMGWLLQSKANWFYDLQFTRGRLLIIANQASIFGMIFFPLQIQERDKYSKLFKTCVLTTWYLWKLAESGRSNKNVKLANKICIAACPTRFCIWKQTHCFGMLLHLRLKVTDSHLTGKCIRYTSIIFSCTLCYTWKLIPGLSYDKEDLIKHLVDNRIMLLAKTNDTDKAPTVQKCGVLSIRWYWTWVIIRLYSFAVGLPNRNILDVFVLIRIYVWENNTNVKFEYLFLMSAICQTQWMLSVLVTDTTIEEVCLCKLFSQMPK